MALRRRALLALPVIAASLLGPRSASACWDGYSAVVGRVSLMRNLGPVEWSPVHAREAARWGARIDALLPDGASLQVFTTEAVCESEIGGCGGVGSLAAGSDDYPRLFRAVAKAFAVKPADVARALAKKPTLYTVQVFAGSAKRATAVATRLQDDDGGWHGFFVEGGFPAMNPSAHILAEGSLHRVVVGTFLTVDEARKVEGELRAAGARGFVRELPAG